MFEEAVRRCTAAEEMALKVYVTGRLAPPSASFDDRYLRKCVSWSLTNLSITRNPKQDCDNFLKAKDKSISGIFPLIDFLGSGAPQNL